jgi:ElaB/YqjD/DUF883 family membrane-anchored ribosome-binding protein
MIEETMTDAKEKTAAVFNKAKAKAKRETDAPAYRTILIAASVGVLLGLLLRR